MNQINSNHGEFPCTNPITKSGTKRKYFMVLEILKAVGHPIRRDSIIALLELRDGHRRVNRRGMNAMFASLRKLNYVEKTDKNRFSITESGAEYIRETYWKLGAINEIS